MKNTINTNTLTILRDNGDSYTVLINRTDSVTGGQIQREEKISRKVLESALSDGYLERVV